MPNLISSIKLNQTYINSTFSHAGFNELVPTSVAKRRHEKIYIRVDNSNTYIKLVDNSQQDIVCLLTLSKENHHGTDYQVVKLSKSEYERRGYLKYIFNVLLHDNDFIIMSDEIHTIPGSKDFWKKIQAWDEIQTSVFNVTTGNKRKYINQEDYKIWGLSEEYFVDGHLNGTEIDRLYMRQIMNKELYDFIKKNQDNLDDRSKIRLIAQKK